MNNTDKIKKTAHETSEKLVEPVAPLGLAGRLKAVGEAQAKVTGSTNMLVRHSTDLALILGSIWSAGKIFYFYYPTSIWTKWVILVDTFFPSIFVAIALCYRLYPHINLFFKKKAKT